MKKNKYVLAGTVVTVALVTLTLTNIAQVQQPGIKRTELQRHDVSIPGHEAIQVRIDLDPGVPFPRHKHPGEEIIYVLQGELEYQVENKPPVTLTAGDVLFIPAETTHAARNNSKTKATELATYIVEKGKPLVEIIK